MTDPRGPTIARGYCPWTRHRRSRPVPRTLLQARRESRFAGLCRDVLEQPEARFLSRGRRGRGGRGGRRDGGSARRRKERLSPGWSRIA